MSWSDLQPAVRAAILVGAVVVVALLVWVFFVSPMRARGDAAERDLATAEAQLEQMEREIESIPPATEAERSSWQASRDEMMSRLGPESELPLLLESLARLADAQGVETFVTSGAAAVVGPSAGRGATIGPSQAEQVFGTVPGARYVPLNIRVYGDYESTGRFISQVGRLGWATAVTGILMVREFPEITTDVGLDVYFRPADANGAGAAPQGAVGGRGGGANG